MEDMRFAQTKKVGILGILGNIFLLIIKGFIGFTTKSQAMIADSFNSAGDIFASLMTFIGNKISSAPQDEDHNFGHGKAEYIFSMFIGISMFVVSFKLLYDSIRTLLFGSELTFSWLLVVTCFITIGVKLFLYLYTSVSAKKFNNILLKANMNDHRNDCIVTTFTLISVLLTLKDIYWFDSLTGIGISIWIAYTGMKFFIESFNVLMDISVDDKTKDLILDIVNSYQDIKEVKSISSSPVGYKYMIVIVICVDGNMSTFDSHALADSVELSVTALDNVYRTIVHVEPI